MAKKDLALIPKKNVFNRFFSEIWKKLKYFFYKDKNFSEMKTDSNVVKREEKRKEFKEITSEKEIQEEKKDISLQISKLISDWTRNFNFNINNSQVSYKEKKNDEGHLYAYYSINGREVLSIVEDNKQKHSKMVHYHYDEQEIKKYGVTIKDKIRNTNRDPYIEEITDYENKKKTIIEDLPVVDLDYNVLGGQKTTTEEFKEGMVKRRVMIDQSIEDIKTGENHRILTESIYEEKMTTCTKLVDGKISYKEIRDAKTGEATIELYDKQGNLSEIHKFDSEGKPTLTLDANGKELVRKGYHMVNGRAESYTYPKPIPGIETYPQFSKFKDETILKDPIFMRYCKTFNRIGIDFNIPDPILPDFIENSDTFDVIKGAKVNLEERIKEDSNRSEACIDSSRKNLQGASR